MNSKLKLTLDDPVNDLSILLQHVDEIVLRDAIGKAAKHKNAAWFKRVDKGKRLGELIARYFDKIQNTPTVTTLRKLENWCYAR